MFCYSEWLWLPPTLEARELKKRESKEKATFSYPAVCCACDPLRRGHTLLIETHGARSEVKRCGQYFKILLFHKFCALQLIKGHLHLLNGLSQHSGGAKVG